MSSFVIGLIGLCGYLLVYLIGRKVGADREYVRQAALEQRFERARKTLLDRIDFLAAENDMWRRRCRKLEEYLVERAHIGIAPSLITRRDDPPPFLKPKQEKSQ